MICPKKIQHIFYLVAKQCTVLLQPVFLQHNWIRCIITNNFFMYKSNVLTMLQMNLEVTRISHRLIVTSKLQSNRDNKGPRHKKRSLIMTSCAEIIGSEFSTNKSWVVVQGILNKDQRMRDGNHHVRRPGD